MNSANSRKGLVILMVLWVVVLLGVIVAVVGKNSRLDTKVRVRRTDDVQCKWACRAGVNTAIAVLNEDLRKSDTLEDLWSKNEEDFNEVELDDCTFTVRVVDEASKLNVNTASRAQLMKLPNMTEEISDAIIDWRDKNDSPSESGVEGGYYENLTFGYAIRNGPFRTIRELLLVKGVTRELLYGEDTNLNGRLDYDEDDGDKSPPDDDEDNYLDEGWIAYLTCYSYDKNKDGNGQNRTNINESSEEDLKKSLGISDSYAKWIVENRKERYRSIADLINKNSPKKPKDDAGRNSGEAEPLDIETFQKIADRITITKGAGIPGRINVNTAPKVVLAALLGDDEGERIAEDIITYRKSLVDGMQSIGELMQIQSVEIDTFKKIAERVTVRSDVYMIRSFATTDTDGLQAPLQTEAVVDRSREPARVLYWYQGPNS